ncbi:hypothetical protein K6U06_06525 [Acidiferrimicrobium sp. IK]|uniref:hypothetical protein n=1 Tax=Acidiferrimicrobium sp. IK TaxID=2871700 RepID=UPI0021CB43A3|nr:hypothetical protein [Acidiferrimicrobium sp. IK]MCU4184008.1 hypothetical protein [Acidiferrimicrobium sp. IK]
MTVINPSAIVDAIQADIATHTTLTPATLRSYAEPTVVPPDSCSLLAVWCENTEYTLLTGAAGLVAYRRTHTIQIGWYDTIPEEADTGGTGDPAEVQALAATAEQIVARAIEWTSGLPGFDPDLVVTLTARKLEPQAGTIWRALVTVLAEQDA